MRRWWWFVLIGCGACSSEISSLPGDGQDPDPEEEVEPAPEPSAEPELLQLTHSTGLPVVDDNVNCRYGENGPHADTRHFRVFDTEAVGGPATVTEVLLPIEVASSPEGVQTATMTLHRLTGEVTAGQFEPLTSVDFDVPDTTLGEITVPVNVATNAGDSIVVEVAMPDGQQERNLRFGHNLEAQTDPTYMASDACGLAQPTDIATLDDPFNPGETFAAHSWLVTLTVEPN